ncbi:hypothetical protein ACS0TY_015578 [Phlomoides rotata]
MENFKIFSEEILNYITARCITNFWLTWLSIFGSLLANPRSALISSSSFVERRKRALGVLGDWFIVRPSSLCVASSSSSFDHLLGGHKDDRCRWAMCYVCCTIMLTDRPRSSPGMESGGSSSLGLKNKGKKMDKTRHTWTPVEEGVLIELMKELVTKGWKTENGFKSGYLLKLEFEMLKKIPGTDLRANPHITSRITIWKKFHGSLQTMLNGNSGIGFNPTTKLLDFHDDYWARIVKSKGAGKKI